MKPYLTHEHPLRFAHRGSRLLWPQNTIEAFQGATDLGYIHMESDVHLTADGVVVLFHDDVLDELTNGTGKVSEWRLEDLKLLDAAYRFKPEEDHPRRGKGVAIPTLEEATTSFPDALWNIDMKVAAVVAPLAVEVERLGLHDRLLAASFHGDRIKRFRRLTGGQVATSAGPLEITQAWARGRLGRTPRDEADAYQVPRSRVLDARFVAAAHAGGKQVHVWTVDSAAEMNRLLDEGVDGIMTDRPDILNDVLAARGQP